MRWLPTLSFAPSSSSSSSSAAAADHRRKAWIFGNSSKKRACHVIGENDARWSEEDSPFSSPGTPQPLPLPELAASPALLRNRDGECRLPSPKDAATSTATTGFRMRRSVFQFFLSFLQLVSLWLFQFLLGHLLNEFNYLYLISFPNFYFLHVLLLFRTES